MNKNKLILKLENLSIGYDSDIVASNINWDIYRNDRYILTGHNGSGKTTLIKTILSLIEPLSGKMTFFDKKNQVVSRIPIGYLPQINMIDRHFPIKVWELIDSALSKHKENKREYIGRMLSIVGLDEYYNKSISVLSGGQLQRLLFARALASEPELLILDEPLSYMDNEYKNLFSRVIEDNVSSDTAIIMITHEYVKEFSSWQNIDFSKFLS